jgi:DNA-binding response OmpR family regulator
VVLTSTVADGLRRAARWHFDLIMLSYTLRDGTGLELFQQIRQFDVHTPILFFVSADHKRALLPEVGHCAQGYLVKPPGIYDLVATVDSLLDAGQSLAKCAAD